MARTTTHSHPLLNAADPPLAESLTPARTDQYPPIGQTAMPRRESRVSPARFAHASPQSTATTMSSLLFGMALALLLALAATTLFGCTLASDSEYALRQHQRALRAQASALESMRDATRIAPESDLLTGALLHEAVADRTFTFHYSQQPGGGRGRYSTFIRFEPDGSLRFRDSLGRDTLGHWRLDGDRLCLVQDDNAPDNHCYRLRRQRDGMLQLVIDEPGSRYHGLLSLVTDRIDTP